MKTPLKIIFFLSLSIFITINTTHAEQLSYAEVLSFDSKALGEERDIYISLPESYARSANHYPVIVVLDAELMFESTQAMVKLLAARNYMPESIVIGLPNKGGYRLDMGLKMRREVNGDIFGWGGKTKQYLQFFRTEVQPALESEYRINDYRVIIGISPTTGPVLSDFWAKDPIFSAYIALSTDFHLYLENNQSIGETLEKSAKKRAQQKREGALYISRADGDLIYEPILEKIYAEYAQKLQPLASTNFRYQVELMDNEEHYGITLQGVKNGLELIFPRQNWTPKYAEYLESETPLQDLKAHYAKLSKKYGISAIPRDDGFWQGENMTSFAQRLFDADRREEALQVFEFIRELYPHSASNYRNMADAYNAVGNTEKAEAYRKRSKQLQGNDS